MKRAQRGLSDFPRAPSGRQGGGLWPIASPVPPGRLSRSNSVRDRRTFCSFSNTHSLSIGPNPDLSAPLPVCCLPGWFLQALVLTLPPEPSHTPPPGCLLRPITLSHVPYLSLTPTSNYFVCIFIYGWPAPTGI